MFNVICINDNEEYMVYSVRTEVCTGATQFLFWSRDEWLWDYAKKYKAKILNLDS